jgi:hypothetical protein
VHELQRHRCEVGNGPAGVPERAKGLDRLLETRVALLSLSHVLRVLVEDSSSMIRAPAAADLVGARARELSRRESLLG